ncbi:MAG: hypothetical protein V3V34_11825 [Kiloniellales bacterium]
MSITTDAAIVLSALAGFPVIKRQPQSAGAPRPPRPYGTIEIQNSIAQSATPYAAMIKDSGEKSLTQVRVGTLFLDVYGDDAQELAEALSLSIRRRSARQAAGPFGILITPIADVPRVPILRDTTWDEVAQVQYQIQWLQRDVEAMERIETVELAVEVNPTDAVFPGLLIDGDMESVGTSSWTPGRNPTLTKETGDPLEGLQSLRIARTFQSNPLALQSILEVGRRYRATGWAKTDGNASFSVAIGGSVSFLGIPGTAWTKFSFAGIADNTDFRLQAITATGTEWAEFDMVSVRETEAIELLEITIEHTDTPP